MTEKLSQTFRISQDHYETKPCMHMRGNLYVACGKRTATQYCTLCSSDATQNQVSDDFEVQSVPRVQNSITN